MSVSYVDTPSSAPIIIVNNPKKPPTKIPVRAVWIITIIICIIIIIIFVALMLSLKPSTLEIPPNDGIVNLDNLLNLDPDGLCCLPPNSIAQNDKYIYLPSTNRTYSTIPVNPTSVCAGLTEPDFTNCINETSNSDGSAKLVAHRGITTYYTFSIGQGNVCQSYQVCNI